jgi:Flp pilus assembly protein TadD
MRKYVQTLLLFAIVAMGVPAFASTATDFYEELLRRGTSEVDAGRYDTSITPLRLAAFGLVDSIPHYQTAQAYLAVAFDKLGQQEEARRAALRVVTAEGIERKFASLPLPAAIRSAFAALATKVLSPADAAIVTATAQTSIAPRPAPAPVTPEVRPQTTTTTPPQQQQTTQQTPQQQVPRNDPPKVVEAPRVAETPKPAPQRTEAPKLPVTQPRNDIPRTTPPTTTTTTTTPPVQKPAAAKPQPVQTQTPAQPAPARVDVASRIAAAERALGSANLVEARRLYREVLAVTTLDRATLIRVGEGLYRSRDFAPALTAFRRLGTLRAGEEAYRYYIAVALYETGDYAAAKRELASALPFIEITPDVQRYRARIEGARN